MAFDAVGELAAQPGGQELSALVARVQQVDPEVLHGMGRRLGSMVEGVDGSLRAVRRHGDDVQGAWQGRGAEALTGYLDDFGRAGTRTLDAAGRIRVRDRRRRPGARRAARRGRRPGLPRPRRRPPGPRRGPRRPGPRPDGRPARRPGHGRAHRRRPHRRRARRDRPRRRRTGPPRDDGRRRGLLPPARPRRAPHRPGRGRGSARLVGDPGRRVARHRPRLRRR